MITLSVALTGHETLIARFKKAPTVLLSKLKSEFLDLALDMRDEAAGKVNSKTGKLAASITASIIQGGSSVGINLGTDGVPYAAIQEDGGSVGPRTITPKDAKALAFLYAGGGHVKGDTAFFSSVDWPGATIPAKHYIFNTLKENRNRFLSIAQKAMVEAMSEDSAT